MAFCRHCESKIPEGGTHCVGCVTVLGMTHDEEDGVIAFYEHEMAEYRQERDDWYFWRQHGLE